MILATGRKACLTNINKYLKNCMLLYRRLKRQSPRPETEGAEGWSGELTARHGYNWGGGGQCYLTL